MYIFGSLGLDIYNKDQIDNYDITFDEDSNIRKGFLFMYSLETILYKNLNKAERERDGSKI